MPKVLPRSFYARDAETVARDLLGKILAIGDRKGRVVETEAYVGEHDLACHASKGRTARTEVMFGQAGHAYVYFIYGMYDMLNVVTGDVGDAQAVLIRAVEPLAGIERSTDGPGKLTRAFGITRAHNGADLCKGPIVFLDGPRPARVGVSPRIGVDYAGVWADEQLRFFDPESDHVSRVPRSKKEPHRGPKKPEPAPTTETAIAVRKPAKPGAAR